MYIRKCPECDNGKMKPIESFRGWGMEYKYSCDTCGHEKWIYEGSINSGETYESSKTGFWIFLIIIELIVFFNDDIITIFDYTLYVIFLIFFIYKVLTPNKLYKNNTNKISYEIIDNIDELTPEEIEEEKILEKAQNGSIKFWIYPFVFVASLLLTIIYGNYYFLVGSIFALAYAYHFGYLDISKNRRKQ